MPRLTSAELQKLSEADRDLYQRKITEFEFLQGLGMQPDPQLEEDINQEFRMKTLKMPVDQQIKIMQRFASPPAPRTERVDIPGLTPGGDPQTVPIQDVEGLRRGNVITQEELTRRLSAMGPKSERSLERGGFIPLRDYREAAQNDFIRQNQAELNRINALPSGSQQQLDALTAFEQKREDYVNQKLQERIPDRADVAAFEAQRRVGGPRQASRFGSPRTRVSPSQIDFQRPGEDIAAPGGVQPGQAAAVLADIAGPLITVAETFIPGEYSTPQERAEGLSILGQSLLPQVIETGEAKVEKDTRLQQIREVAFAETERQIEDRIGAREYRAMSPKARTKLMQTEMGRYFDKYYENARIQIGRETVSQQNRVPNYEDMVDALAARQTQQFVREVDPANTDEQNRFYNMYKDKYSFAASDIQDFTAKAIETLFTNRSDPAARDKLFRLGLIPDRNTITESTGGTLLRDVNLLFRIFENPIIDSLTTTVDKDGNILEDELISFKPRRQVGEVEKGRALEAPTVDVEGQGLAGYMKELGIETARARGLGNDIASLNAVQSTGLGDEATYLTTIGELFIPLPGMVAAKGIKGIGGMRGVIKGSARSRQIQRSIRKLEQKIADLGPEAAEAQRLPELLKEIKAVGRKEKLRVARDIGLLGLQGYNALPSTLLGAGTESIRQGLKASRALRYFDAEKANLQKLEESLDMSDYAGSLDDVQRAKFYDAVLEESGVGHQLIGFQADRIYDITNDIALANKFPGRFDEFQKAAINRNREALQKMAQNDDTPALREMARAAIRDPMISKNRLVEIGLETGAMRSYDDYVLISPNLVMRKDAVKAKLPGAIELVNDSAKYEQIGFNQYRLTNPDFVQRLTQYVDGGTSDKYISFIVKEKIGKDKPLDIEEVGYIRQFVLDGELRGALPEVFETQLRVVPGAAVEITKAERLQGQTPQIAAKEGFPVQPGSPVERRLREAERTTVFNTTTKPKTPTQVSKEIDRIQDVNNQLGKSGKKAIGISPLPARANRAQERIIGASDQISRQMIPALKEAGKRFGTAEKTVDALIAADIKGENFLNILSTPERFADDIATAPADTSRLNEYFYNLTMDVVGNPPGQEARALIKRVVDEKTARSATMIGPTTTDTPTGIMTEILDTIEELNPGLLKQTASLDDIVLNRTYLNAKRAKTRAIIREEILSQGEFIADLGPLKSRTGFNNEEAVQFFDEVVSRKAADNYQRFELDQFYRQRFIEPFDLSRAGPEDATMVGRGFRVGAKPTPEGNLIASRVLGAGATEEQKVAYLNKLTDDIVSGELFEYSDDIAANQLRLNYNALDDTTRAKYSGREAEYRANYLRQNLQSSARKFLDDQYIIADPETKRFISELMEDSFGDPAALKANLDNIARDQYATGAVMRSMDYQLSLGDRIRTTWISGQLGGQYVPNIAYQAENLITAPLIAYITRPNSGLIGGSPEIRAILKQMGPASIGKKPQEKVFIAAKKNPEGQFGNTRYTNQQIANAMNTENLGNTAQAAELSRALQVDYQRTLRSADGKGLVAGAKRNLTDIIPFTGRTTPFMRYAMNVDMSFREAVFLARVEAGDDLAKAARIAKDTMLDYGATPVKNFLNKQGVGKYFLYLSFLESTSRSILKALRQPNGLNRVLRMANYHNKMMNKLGQEKRGLIGDEALQSLWISTFDIYNPDKKVSEPIEGYATYLRNPQMGALYWFMNTADRTIGALQAPQFGMSLQEGFKALEEGVYSPYIQAGRQLATTGERRVPETYLKRLALMKEYNIPYESIFDYGIKATDVSDQELGRFAAQPKDSTVDPMSGYQYKFSEGGYGKFAAAMLIMNMLGAERAINDYTYMWAESGALPKGTYFARDENGNGLWVLPEAVGRKRTRRLPRSWEAQDRALRQQLREIQRIQKKQSKESLE